MGRIPLCGAVLSVIALYSASCLSQTREERIFSALAEVTASGQNTNGVPFSSQGTGFVVSPAGVLLSVNHIISALPNIDPATLTFSIRIGGKSENEMKFGPDIVVTRDVLSDLLVLKIPTPASNRAFLCFLPKASESTIVFNQTQVYTSGFPSKLPYVTFPGVINFEGPGGTWITTTPIYEGQSGSPFYDERGRVLGIAKGSIVAGDGAPLNVVIPQQAVRSVADQYIQDCPGPTNVALGPSSGEPIAATATVPANSAPPPAFDSAVDKCVFVGRLSGLTTGKADDAPFGKDTLASAASGNGPGALDGQSLKAITTVNIRAGCPIQRAQGLNYYGPVLRAVKQGELVHVKSVTAYKQQDDTSFWASVQ